MGKASKQVILELAANIEQFNEIVRAELLAIQQNAFGLASCWNDPQYREFLAFTTDITSELQNDIALLEVVEKNLKIKADKF